MDTLVIEGPNGQIGATVAGSGTPLVLVAGLGSTARIWGEFPALLGRHFTVICPDNRGVGESKDGLPFTFERAADDIVTLLDYLGFTTAALFGASMGGTIGLATCIRHGSRIKRLALASCAAHLSRHGRHLLDLLDILAHRLPATAFGTILTALAFAPPFHEEHPELVRTVAALYGPDPEDFPGLHAQLDYLRAGWDLRPYLGSVTVPALVFAGDRDPIVAREDTQDVATHLPSAAFQIVSGAAHSVLAEGGPNVLDQLVRFLEGSPAS